MHNELGAHAGSTGLNGLNLGIRPRQPVEPLWELGAVKELALLGLHGAQGSARAAANGALGEGGTAERAVLLGLGAVVREGVRECPGGRGRVRTRRVVDGFCGLSATR